MLNLGLNSEYTRIKVILMAKEIIMGYTCKTSDSLRSNRAIETLKGYGSVLQKV